MYQTYYAEAASTHDVPYSSGIIGYDVRKEVNDTDPCYFVFCCVLDLYENLVYIC